LSIARQVPFGTYHQYLLDKELAESWVIQEAKP